MQDSPHTSPTPVSEAPREVARSRRSASLVARLTRWNMAVLVSTVVLCFVVIATTGWFSAQERQASLSQGSAQVLANSLAPMLVFEDREAARSELQSFARRGDVLEVQLLLTDGQTFAGWTAPGQASDMQASEAMSQAVARHVADAQMLRVWIPVELRGERVGTLYLRESLQALRQQLQRAILMVALLLGVALSLIHI